MAVLSSDCLFEVFAFLNRQELSQIAVVSRYMHKFSSINFPRSPFYLFGHLFVNNCDNDFQYCLHYLDGRSSKDVSIEELLLLANSKKCRISRAYFPFRFLTSISDHWIQQMTSINCLWMKLEMSFFRAINMENSPDEIFAKILSYKNVWKCPHLLINFSCLMQSTYDLCDLSPLHECQKLELCEFEEKLTVTDLTNYLHSFFIEGQIVLKLHLYENQWQHFNAFLDEIKETFLCSRKPQSFKVEVASWISIADNINQESFSMNNKLTNEQLYYDWPKEVSESELCCTIQRISL